MVSCRSQEAIHSQNLSVLHRPHHVMLQAGYVRYVWPGDYEGLAYIHKAEIDFDRRFLLSRRIRRRIHQEGYTGCIRKMDTILRRRRSRVNLSFDKVGSENATVNGGKPPIIFLHGLTSAKETWKNIIRPIAAATGRKAYAYDARNHGDSGWSEDFHYEIMQEDLLEFIDCLHVKQVVLIGHSMGGKTAMFFAAKNPGRVEKLLVEDISPKPSQPHLRTQVIKYISFLKFALEQIPSEIKDLDEAKNFVQDFLHRKEDKEQESSRSSATDGSILPLYQDEDGKFRWKTNLKVIEDSFLGAPNKSTLIGTYPGPTLILYGTKSPYKVSADRDFIRNAFTSSQFRAIEGATHQIHLEYEDIFVKEVTDFINDL